MGTTDNDYKRMMTWVAIALIVSVAAALVIVNFIMRAYAEDVWEPLVSSKFVEPDFGSLADYAGRGRRLMTALLSHLQQTAFDDAAASVVLSEVGQAEQGAPGPAGGALLDLGRADVPFCLI